MSFKNLEGVKSSGSKKPWIGVRKTLPPEMLRSLRSKKSRSQCSRMSLSGTVTLIAMNTNGQTTLNSKYPRMAKKTRYRVNWARSLLGKKKIEHGNENGVGDIASDPDSKLLPFVFFCNGQARVKSKDSLITQDLFLNFIYELLQSVFTTLEIILSVKIFVKYSKS